MSKHDKCEDYREAITALVLGEPDTRVSAETRRHLERCQDCRSLREALDKEEQEILSAFDEVKVGLDPLESKIQDRFQHQSDQSQQLPLPR